MASSRWKRWIGRIFLVTVPSLFLIFSLELTCHVLGWGFPTSFLVPDKIGERSVWRSNEFYGYRFFQPLMARSPAPIVIDREKADGVQRIAVLGESAAMGDPLIEFSLARALDKTLNKPGQPRRYEVVNAGMTAISSPVIVDIAEELAKKNFDYFVVYMGNNEAIGPYGPGTVFQTGSAAQWLAPWHVRWTRSRLASAIQSWKSAASPGQPWDGMAMFAENRIAADNPQIEAIHQSYRKNLERIVAIAARHGIKAILCTIAVNLRDCPPFGSAHGRGLSEENLKTAGASLDRGKQALARGNFADARQEFAEALLIDSGHAETNYLLAVAAERSGDTDAAALHYRRARDLDTLRVRTDTRMNTLVREVAGRSGVPLIESDELFGPVPGAESFVDHVHFTLEGVALLAGAVANTIDENSDRLDTETLADRMDYNDWSRRKLATIMLQRLENPPFLDQAGNTERMAQWQSQREALQGNFSPPEAETIVAELRDSEAAYPWDSEYAVQSLHRLAGIGAWPQAAELADRIRPGLRGSSAVHGLVALAYAKAGRSEDAVDALLAQGPPYGYFLIDSTLQLLGALTAMGEASTARDVAGLILARVPDFPGRPALVRWTEAAES